MLPDQDHAQATRLSNAWETANALVAEPVNARHRFASLSAAQSTNSPLSVTVL
jgi:hypothetical protein